MISVVAPPQKAPMDVFSSITEVPVRFSKPRRRYETHPVTSWNSVSVTGLAHLCFSDDRTWFEGHLVASSDESQYGLVGRCLETATMTTELDTKCPSLTYDVSVIDHDGAETYAVGSVVLTFEELGLCSLTSQSLRFVALKAFHGQKADMLIQSYLTPRLVGKNLRVYFGQLSVDLTKRNVMTVQSERKMWYYI